jgi:hypothetical protein
MERASGELRQTQPAKVANSDAKALARYLAAAGIDIDADRLNDLLALLAVHRLAAGGRLVLGRGRRGTTIRLAVPVSNLVQQFA